MRGPETPTPLFSIRLPTIDTPPFTPPLTPIALCPEISSTLRTVTRPSPMMPKVAPPLTMRPGPSTRHVPFAHSTPASPVLVIVKPARSSRPLLMLTVPVQLPLSTPLPDLSVVPELEPSQFLSRELWLGKFGSNPTDAYYISELQRSGGICFLTYEVWKNCGGGEHTPLLLASGQYTLRALDGGSVVHLHSFYKGQSFPALVKLWVVERTRTFYKNFSSRIRELSPSWRPDSRTREWAEDLGWKWE